MVNAPYPLQPQPIEKSWLERNARWKIPLGCVTLLFLMAVFGGTLVTVIVSSFRSSDAYQQALAEATRNSQVRDYLGEPVKPGWFISGQISVSGSTGSADLSIPISGPRGKGAIRAVANKKGVWKFTYLQVTIEGQTDPINLLPNQGLPPPISVPDDKSF